MPDEYTANEKRQYPRFPLKRAAFIELLAADMESEDGSAGEVVPCYTVDVSRGGLQVRIHHPLTPGSILQIAVDMSDGGDTLYLAAEVRWSELGQVSGQGWIAGFMLMDAVDSDLDDWHGLLLKMAS